MTEWALTLHDKIIKRFTIVDGQVLTIGRGSDAAVIIDNTAISRKHSSLELNDGVYYLSDLKSTNGTFVNGKRIDQSIPIALSDTINIGKFRLLPADMLTQDTAAVSASSMDMDMEDETVFVSTKTASKVPQVMDRSVKEKPNNQILVVEGDATPKAISLDGKSSVKIGKDPSCDMVIGGWFVAGAQCYIITKDDKFIIVPQRSWVKTRLNGSQISEERVLRKGDIIEIKNSRMRFD
ncbi:MAG: FHA domain-containing protein [Proteobacteria bacterium]|nr:FHA domain-containing protein [Pseudomonadota bacterium]MBU1711038.1 FHA domain-containing protein [Pseudomonadota bacterium]